MTGVEQIRQTSLNFLVTRLREVESAFVAHHHLLSVIEEDARAVEEVAEEIDGGDGGPIVPQWSGSVEEVEEQVSSSSGSEGQGEQVDDPDGIEAAIARVTNFCRVVADAIPDDEAHMYDDPEDFPDSAATVARFHARSRF
jgi:hypothetical protein